MADDRAEHARTPFRSRHQGPWPEIRSPDGSGSIGTVQRVPITQARRGIAELMAALPVISAMRMADPTARPSALIEGLLVISRRRRGRSCVNPLIRLEGPSEHAAGFPRIVRAILSCARIRSVGSRR